ncbi:MAG: tetratricopeptide repeat protein [Cyanobacteria bacterium J06607_13]
MGIDAALEYADQLLYERTGKHLSDLQSYILQQTWQGRTYSQVATHAGYSEGHVKDVASQLWKHLSDALGERITKGNLRSRLINRLKRTLKSAPGSAAVIATIRGNTPQPTAAQPTVIQPTECPTVDPTFLGRQSALTRLDTLAKSHRIIVVQGEGGIGKTTLAQQYCQKFDQVLELLMAKEPANITPVESVVEEWLRQHFHEEPGRAFGVTLSRLKRHLQTQQIAVLIDNLEPALNSSGQFITEHRHYVELLRVLASASATVLITSRDRLCEPGIKVHHYRLPGLALSAWQQFFQAHDIDTQASAHFSILQQMHRAYGGNAKAMEILCAAALEDFDGDLGGYWQENEADLLGTADLRNLVGSQVDRLQQQDPDAYRVFCRLGCYRYQDQPQLNSDAILALMWDIPPAAQRQTLNSLRDRSLLEFHKGHYWLHPVSRADAIARLRQSHDWQQANHTAARYWSDRIQTIRSVEDGLQALEAYYHLIAAQDYNAAAAVLLKSRHNQWRQFLPLASSLYRMGLLQPVINAITQVLPHVQVAQSELNNILGDVYWITGDIHRAIACQEKTLEQTEKQIAQQASEQRRSSDSDNNSNSTQNNSPSYSAYYFKMLTVDAHLSIGLYCIDLWELSRAAEQFQQVINLAAGSAHQAWADKATIGLALTQAYLGQTATAEALANRAFAQFTTGPDDEHGRHAYFLQLLGQTFEQVGALGKAQTLYERAMASAEAGHYVQVKAKTLTGLASLQRQQGESAAAIALHTQAIELCKNIGATCDLAEAYFQLGRSVQGDHAVADQPPEPQHERYFEQAIALFSKIRAPHQVERVVAAKRAIA